MAITQLKTTLSLLVLKCHEASLIKADVAKLDLFSFVLVSFIHSLMAIPLLH